jgi:hypothetical protein
METSYVPVFSETERTPAQRLESVQWAVGVSASAGGAPSLELVQLYERYILGEISLAGIRAEVEHLYPKQPTTDPYPRYRPELSGKPSPPHEPLPADYNTAEAAAAEPTEPESSADECVAQLRAFVADIQRHAAEMPPRQPYTRLDV